MTIKTITHSPEETEAAGEKLAKALKCGDIIALYGTLGAGKTAFVRGLARGLGFNGRVTSPTFNIVNEYRGGRTVLCHFDLYRLSTPDELFDIGWEDYLSSGAVCAVEWSENAAEAMPERTVRVEILPQGESGRLITLDAPCSFEEEQIW